MRIGTKIVRKAVFNTALCMAACAAGFFGASVAVGDTLYMAPGPSFDTCSQVCHWKRELNCTPEGFETAITARGAIVYSRISDSYRVTTFAEGWHVYTHPEPGVSGKPVEVLAMVCEKAPRKVK